MSNILIGQSYYLRFDPKLWAAMQPYPPLGAMLAASFLRSQGHTVSLFDAMLAESEQEWAQELDQIKPRFAVLFEDNFNYLSKMCLLRIRQAAYTMMRMAQSRDCTVIAAGSDASDHPGEYLAEGADFVLIGEGEITLGELLDRFSTPQSRSKTDEVVNIKEVGDIRGLAYRDEDGQVIITPHRPDLRELDNLPFPAWDLIHVERYRKIWLARHGYFSMNIVSTRGCPFHCNWCAKPIWGQRYNQRSPENVVAEMKWLSQTYRPDHLWFADDILGLKPGWLERFADLLELEGVQLPFKSLNRADLLLRGETIPALQRAGADMVWIGAESGSQKILDAMEKGTRQEQIVEAARRLKAARIGVGFFLQFGYPGETLEDIQKTIQMVRRCRPDDIGISVSYPLPGTRFYERVQSQLGVKKNWYDSQDLDMLYHGPFNAVFYRKLHTTVHREFRMHKTWGELREFVRQPAGRRRGIWRRTAGALLGLVTLPFYHLQIRWLARKSAGGLGPLSSEMDPQAASEPSPQGE